MPVAIFKECINKFYNDGNTVYACFLDLSKAFEESHEQLLSKLAYTDLTEFVVKFLSCTFINSSVSVNVNGVFFPTAGMEYLRYGELSRIDSL